MILFDENYEKIYRQMLNEKEKVSYYLHKNEDRIFKKYKQKPELPVWYHETIVMPGSNNKYLLYYYCLKYAEVHDKVCYCGSVLLTNNNDGKLLAMALRRMKTSITKDNKRYIIDTIQVFDGHFFSRYRERMKFHDSMSTHDIIASFFGRCGGYFTKLNYDEMTIENHKGKGNSCWGIDDGITFANEQFVNVGSFTLMVVNHNTFLPRSMLKEDQVTNSYTQEEMRSQCLEHFK